MRHRTDHTEKLSRALELHEEGISSAVIAERLGMTTQAAARTIVQAKARRRDTYTLSRPDGGTDAKL
jgi:hypothetical protein